MSVYPPYMLASGLVLAFAAPAVAQDNSSEATEIGTDFGDFPADGEILVQGDRLRGQLNVEQAPVLELDEQDILAIGANSVGDLIAAIGPQTGSSRGRGGGRPVFLVNGIRISSFRELRSYPPEAVAKVEVMPEEVAQRFGFPPDRRVVNLILKENYSSREIELEFEAPDRGGYWRNEQEFTLLTINDGARMNLNLERGDGSLLTEAERDVEQTAGSVSDVASDPDQALYRSLVPELTEYEATLNWAKAYLESGSSLSFNATYEREESLSLSGLDTVLLAAPDGSSALRTFGEDDPLRVRSNNDTFSAAGSWTKPLGRFQFTATSDASFSETETRIDRRADTQELVDAAFAGALAIDGALPDLPDAGFDVANRRSIVAENKVTLRGSPLLLPAGEVTTTFDLGFDWRQIDSSDTRAIEPGGEDTKLTRRRFEGGLNVVVPLTSKREGFLDALGSISANFSLGFEDLSDFGSLTDWTAGINWSPWSNLDLQATYVWREVAPSLSDLGNPRVETLNVPVFDLVNGETVLATLVTGGNPDLLAETQRDWRFSANWELPFWENTRLSAEYIRNRSADVTSAFPALSTAVEAAFPDRVIRDASGTLTALDRRPVTYESTRNERLVFGLTTRGSWGAAAPRRGGGRPQAAANGRGGPPERAIGSGPPSDEQRERFMTIRERLCADDGMAFLERLAGSIERGDDLSVQFPDLDLNRAQAMLDRLKDENGKIDRERLTQFRERICSMDPAQMRGGPSGGDRGVQQPRGQAAAGARRGPPRNPVSSGFGRDGRGRYFFNLTHTIELDNQILIADGGPLLDLLEGDTQSDFGQARHSSRLEAGFFRNGKGLRISGSYTGSARIDGNEIVGTSPLSFSDLVRFDLRFFADIGRLAGVEKGFLQGFRMTLRADNIFDAQRRVTDADGNVPLRYQPLLLDPNGRYLGIDFRKVF